MKSIVLKRKIITEVGVKTDVAPEPDSAARGVCVAECNAAAAGSSFPRWGDPVWAREEPTALGPRRAEGAPPASELCSGEPLHLLPLGHASCQHDRNGHQRTRTPM